MLATLHNPYPLSASLSNFNFFWHKENVISGKLKLLDFIYWYASEKVWEPLMWMNE